jgi:hypothetical protein
VRISVFKLDGTEVEVWKGVDPTPVGSGSGISEVPVKVDFEVHRVKIYLDSKNVPDWNEIDAVGIRDKAKKMHWAVACEASTTYAPPPQGPAAAEVFDERVRRLEDDVREIKKMLAEIQKLLKKEP